MNFQQLFVNGSDDLQPTGLFDGFSSGWDQFKSAVKTLDMKRALSLVMTFVAYVTSQDPRQVIQGVGQGIQNVGEGVGQGISKEVLAIKHPIDETIVTVGSSQCTNVKNLFGISYEQLQGEREPDVTSLSLVYRTRDSTRTYNISNAAESLRQARAFESREKLVVFVHGFTDDPSGASFADISNSFFKSEEGDRATLVALDGSPLIRWLYLRSTTYVMFIGEKLAEVLAKLYKNGLDPSQIHMVGHSLGAHISSFAGKRFFGLTQKKIGRITGLDPAGPCFTHVDSGLRLEASDAAHVDVIHTDGGVYGMRTPVGHVDYYPNSGAQQPDCLLQTCSHSRAWQLFAESIQSRHAFPARRCDSWEQFTQGNCSDEISYMGYASKPETRGLFFLQTGGKVPYGRGPAGLNYTNNAGIVRNVQGALGAGVKNLPFVG